MAIYCRKCCYEMSKSEAIIHISPKIYTFIKDIVIPCVYFYFSRKGIVSKIEDFSENLIIYTLNQDKIPCQSCAQYEWWQNDQAKELVDKQKQRELQ